MAARDEHVQQLARTLTQQSTFTTTGKNPFAPEDHPELDPQSSQFNPRAWTKAMMRVRLDDPESFHPRTAGVAFRNLNVHGFGQETDYQRSVGNVIFEAVGMVRSLLRHGKRKIDILRDFDGLVRKGEMLVVLGPPGSGCSTLLKTISGETHGIYIGEDSYLNYQGINAQQMQKNFRGEAIYTAEVDVHFPMLSVGDTLTFAARARAPRKIPGGVSLSQYSQHLRDVIMAVFGISHTVNTRVGNDFIRGVSGGERKRVTIAEASLSGAPLQCWDNSTRGLDSANAVEFCKTLRMNSDISDTTACVAIYQSPQSAYDTFDKATVLYRGRQIYFGPCNEARKYFEDMGFQCPDRQTTPDFLTSMTSAEERVVQPGWEDRVPRTPDEFAARWKESEERKRLLAEIDEYDKENPFDAENLENFKKSRRTQQAKAQSVKSPYTLSYTQQVLLCVWRGIQRLKGDPSVTIFQIFFNSVLALVIGSVFYNMSPSTDSFFQRGALLFFAVLMNAFGSALEILVLYAQRPIVEKHSRYAFYHPSAEAFASMLCDIPYKVCNSIFFNLAMYFLANLRREPGPFFFLWFVSFILTLSMSMLFRTIASVSRTLSQALAPAAILILAVIIYTGFAIPITYMRGWARWINYINPVAYGFESLMINEFHNRDFPCTLYLPMGPGYENVSLTEKVCSSIGSVPGQDFVNGDVYINSAFQYYHANKWRNVGILWGFIIGFMMCYLAATEFISSKKSKGEVLLFPRNHIPATAKRAEDDPEAGSEPNAVLEQRLTHDPADVIQRQTAVFHWEDICYDIKIKNEERRILNHVDGWVKPGTLTALMGVSGAGKTTLLDVLATRTTMGVISGDALVDGRQRDASFQRKTGYVQQQDLHLPTSTVREALTFSALLRQPAKVPREEKLAYVNEVIKLLDMQEYADAVVGVPGEGLNVEQRKRLTIGVELAAKPELLLFLDEPTSGLDSQTSWAVCDLMEKLTNAGQAILCTIHQPSAMLFQRFDRLLFLASGGRPVYFGEIGKNSEKLLSYFERNGASPCPPDANPAEYMLAVTGAAPGTTTDIDWPETWRSSPEYDEVKDELASLRGLRRTSTAVAKATDETFYHEFAAPFGEQFRQVLRRVFEQYWRTPSYIYSKLGLCLTSALFIGFSFFRADNTQQGLQNQMFAIFMLMNLLPQLTQQIMPHFVTQRALYESRERPSKAYSWKAFMLANILVEIPWNTLMAGIIFVSWYYPIGMYRNAQYADQTDERGAMMFLYIWIFLLFASTFADLIIAGIEDAEAGAGLANLLFSLCLIFCGVLASPAQLPRFWIFMYRVSPFTYLIDGLLSVGVANTFVTCAENELLHFDPPSGQTCEEYLDLFKKANGGNILNPGATADCSFCAIDSTNTFLTGVSSSYDHRWRNFGILWVYIIVNVAGALGLYWLARVPKKAKTRIGSTPCFLMSTRGYGMSISHS
ncbi:ABC drug exporter AbcA [Eremomyces bilateralis CBS 781.70]|uniref:ABC drug exporter AbcA n=1 Tax=Eremomyces bilateralis CBS 781.70 TaxID=1392243 RepID=A0A6G1FS90_9PEZI|nr:ABC drug exporter AbcA [Eremomyces bilateralis CBS 781.70]KAF1808725.1 ABC drug exporter AbcA [Eremomyces bilateralis CBS 781.70]